jgi:hypothetical protein
MRERITTAICLTILAGTFQFAQGQTRGDLAVCSTEKVNDDCVVTVDRNYPVTLPTIQMSPRKKVLVRVVNPLPFETLTLDPQSAQLLPGADQAAGLVTAVIPDLKNFSLISKSNFDELNLNFVLPIPQRTPELSAVQEDLATLSKMLNVAIEAIDPLFDNVTKVYAQLKQIVSPLPRPEYAQAPGVPDGTPDPWNQYGEWRTALICEFAGGEGCNTVFTDVLGTADSLQKRLPVASGPQPANLLFNSKEFDRLADKTEKDIEKLPQVQRPQFTSELKRRRAGQTRINTSLTSLAVNLPNIMKDMQAYFGNINLAKPTIQRSATLDLGVIYDPKTGRSNRFLGRQVAFSVNAVNQISTFIAAVPTSSQKTSLETITVLYANPIFEVSAGAFFSSLPNRSFANQTAVTQNPGGFPTLGNISIVQTDTRPEIIPFAGANWRLGPEFVWPGGRRGAVYLTLAAALNPYNTMPEFGGGLSLSWRSLLFTPMYHLGHGVHLTQGEGNKQVWCNVSATAGSTPPPCSPAPPNPSTKNYWTNAVGFGVSVRVPTVFTAGSGGVSR